MSRKGFALAAAGRTFFPLAFPGCVLYPVFFGTSPSQPETGMNSNFCETWATKIQKFADEHKLLIILLAILIFFFRRPGQFLYPYIWDEDGLDILPQYIESGLSSLFFPEKGYFIFISRLVNILSVKISFFYYPQIAFLLTLIFQLYVVYAIIYSPTKLKYKLICGFSVLLLKTDPECFLVPLYNFWWAGILLILVTIWDDDKKRQDNSLLVRIVYIFVGGFSSPLIVFATPLLYLRYYLYKTKENLFLFVFSLIPFISQFSVILYSMIKYGSFSKSTHLSVATIHAIIRQFISNGIIISNDNFVIILIFILYSVIIYSLIKKKRRSSWLEWLNSKYTIIALILWQAGAIIASAARLDIASLMAPRYLFYPYIILNFIILYAIYHVNGKIVKLSLFISLFFPLFDGSVYGMSRDQQRIGDWQQQIAYILRTGNTTYLKDNYDGYHELYSFKLSYNQCKYLIQKSLMFNNPFIDRTNNEVSTHDLNNLIQKYNIISKNDIKIHIDHFFKNYYSMQRKLVDLTDNIINLDIDRPFQGFLIMGHITFDNEHLHDIFLKIDDKVYTAHIDEHIFYSPERKEKYKNFTIEFNQENVVSGKHECSIIVLTTGFNRYQYDFTLNVKNNFSNTFQQHARSLPNKIVKKKCIGSLDQTEYKNNLQHISGWLVHSVSPNLTTDNTYLLTFSGAAENTAFPAFTVERMDVAITHKTWHFKDTGFYAAVPSGQEYWIGYEREGRFHQCINLHIPADGASVK